MIWVHTSHLKLALERIIWISSSKHWEWKLSQENQAQSCPPSGTSRNRLDWQKSLCQILSTRATLAPLYFSHLYFVCCLFLISPAVFVFLCLLYFPSTWEGAWLLLRPLPNLSQTGPRFAGNRGRGRKKKVFEAEAGSACVLLTTFVYRPPLRTPARVVWRTRRPHRQRQQRQVGWSEFYIYRQLLQNCVVLAQTKVLDLLLAFAFYNLFSSSEFLLPQIMCEAKLTRIH